MEKQPKKKRTLFEKVVITIVLVVLFLALAYAALFGYALYITRTTHHDETSEIKHLMGREFVCKWPMVLRREDEFYLEVHKGVIIEDVKKYCKERTLISVPCLDVLQPGTKFEITKLELENNPWAGKFRHLYLKIRSGKHKGKTYRIGQYYLMEHDEADRWKWKPYVSLAK